MRDFVIFYLYPTVIRIPLIIENDSSRIKILQKSVCDNYNNCALLKNNKKKYLVGGLSYISLALNYRYALLNVGIVEE